MSETNCLEREIFDAIKFMKNNKTEEIQKYRNTGSSRRVPKYRE